MKDKKKAPRKPSGSGAQTVGFWARSEPVPAIVSVRHSSSKLARSLTFLRKIVGGARKKD